MMTEAEQKKAGTLSLPALRQQALALHKAGKFTEAIKVYRMCLALAPQDKTLWINLGVAAQIKLKSFDQEIWHVPAIRHEADKVVITLNIIIKRINGVRMLLSPDGKDLVLSDQIIPDPAIVQALGRGFKWREMLEEQPDMSIYKFAKVCGFGDTYITSQLMLLRLSPDIIHRALSGTLPSAIKLNRLAEAAKCLSWDKQ